MRRRAEARIGSTLAAELRPWLRMTVPRGAGGLDVRSLEPGPVGRSWILARRLRRRFGGVPLPR